jgi:hypothetical protein
MTPKKENPVVDYFAQAEAVRLTNWFIRVAWRTTALLIVITIRAITAIIFAVVRIKQRKREW